MLLAGRSITSCNELLKKVSLDYLYNSLRNPKPELASQIRQLRIVREIDSSRYSSLKRMLPFFVCGVFNPAIRRTENFAYIEYFVIDIDHIASKGLDLQSLKAKIIQDSRVCLCFVSPGEDGLKVLFRLSERCYDARIYSLFYKAFVEHFTQLFGLEQVIDKCTSDVSRACFISMDKDAYYQPNAESVNLKAFVLLDDPDYMNKSNSLFNMTVSDESLNKEEGRTVDPDTDTIQKIKEILNPKLADKKPLKDVYVPPQLDAIMQELCQYIQQMGISIEEISNIQYGKKMKFQLGHQHAEINLFHGKRGFTVVISPRCGTSTELNELISDVIHCFFKDYQTTS